MQKGTNPLVRVAQPKENQHHLSTLGLFGPEKRHPISGNAWERNKNLDPAGNRFYCIAVSPSWLKRRLATRGLGHGLSMRAEARRGFSCSRLGRVWAQVLEIA